MLDRMHPIDLLFLVDKIAQRDHHQERAPEGRDRDVRVVHDPRVFIRLCGSQSDGLPRAYAGGDDDDGQRTDDPHPNDSDQDAPCQEPLLLFRGHVLELVGIHNRIIEGQRDFENRQNATN